MPNLQTGMGTKSTMVVRKTPSGSNSSSKTKKLKVASTAAPGSGLGTTKVKLKTTGGGSLLKHGNTGNSGNVA